MGRKLRKFVVKLPLLGPIVIFLYRAKLATSYYIKPILRILRWLFRSREITNFTYDLTPVNRAYLVSVVAIVTKKSREEISGYVSELERDQLLRAHIATSILQHKQFKFADPIARYGRRIGWYAVARAIKPKVIVETGVDQGLGACILTSALQKNHDEGYPGHYYGTDINPRAGYLLGGIYKDFGTLLYGDSIASLDALEQRIDLFINDSDHSAAYEAREYQSVAGKLHAHSIILGDNAHVTDELLQFACATHRAFLYFQEHPLDHWYPGAGIGFAFFQEM